MPDEAAELISAAIQKRVFPGCVAGVVRQNGARAVLPLGHLTYEKDSPEVAENTIYDLASVTKSIPVASLALRFVAEGKLSLGDPAAKYIPELRNDFGATIEDLLRYRVHGARMSALKYETFEEIRTRVFERGFEGPPGQSAYANLPAFLLGIALERVAGEILPALAHKRFFEPLAMNDTTFFPHDLARAAPTEVVEGVEVRGIVHDESARVFARARRAVGHAGLFSTAPDLLNFLEMLLRGGAIAFGAERGLGFEVNEPWMGKSRGERTFGKTGFTGTSVAVDRGKGIAFVILSNRTYPRRPFDSSAINAFRADIADVICSQFTA